MVTKPYALIFLLVLDSCARKQTLEGESSPDSSTTRTNASEVASDSGLADAGYRYEPHCKKIPSRKDGEPPHVERDGNLFRLCDTQLELETPAVVDVPPCQSCNISDTCNSSWNFQVCGALVKVRIDTDWAKIVGRDFAEADVVDVEYAELFGRSAHKAAKGMRHRVVDLIFRHGHHWRAHIEYTAPTMCADQIDEMIASAHVPTTFPDDQTVPLPHDE